MTKLPGWEHLNISERAVRLLVIMGALKYAAVQGRLDSFKMLRDVGLVRINEPDEYGTRAIVAITDLGKQVLREHSPKELVDISLSAGDAVAATWYMHDVEDIGDLTEFLAHWDSIIRRAATHRFDELTGKSYRLDFDVEPIRTVTMILG